MKKIIVANWKMNPNSLKEAKQIFREVKKMASRMSRVETIICPPFIFISNLKSPRSRQGEAEGGQISNLKLGAQDVFWAEKGAFTGEISAAMLKNLRVKYVIIGHSERREMGETDEIIKKKIKTGLKSGLKVIFCIGEKKRDSEGGYLNFIKDQIKEGLRGIPRKLFANLIIAYEPVWAISSRQSSRADNPESVFRTAIFIRRTLLPIVGDRLARRIPILYGGSIELKNAERFLREGGVQGLLVGSQSLIPKNFNEILKIANKK
jgi:triosephosphate isomerase